MMYPSWPLNTRFRDRDNRIFEVRHVIMGDPNEGLSWEIETAEGLKITSAAISAPQTKVGFVELEKADTKMIYESPEKLDLYVKNRHLIRL